MTGHQPLIDMRKAGVLPGRIVYLVDAPDPAAKLWQDGSLLGGFVPTIELDEKDNPSTLDLRFLVGLTVNVLSIREREDVIHNACVAAGAKKVVSCKGKRGSQTVRITEDKKEVLHG